jgi:hypothetical protein
MGLLAKIHAYRTTFRNRRRDQPFDLVRLLRRHRGVLFGVNAMELAQMASGRVDARLKALAAVKTSALVGCPF